MIGPPADAPVEVDQKLRAFCTDKQWGYLCAWVRLRSYRAVGKATGVDNSTIREAIAAIYSKAARRGYAPAHDLTHPLPDGLALKGTSVRYNGAGEVEQFWNKSKQDGRGPDEVVHLPDPKVLSKVSTLYDQEGRVVQQWVAEKPKEAERLKMWQAAAEEMAKALPRLDPVPPSKTAKRGDVLAGYPVGDHHLGMLSWNQETGADWDIKIAEETLDRATAALVDAVAPADQALVAYLGDFLHYDSFEAVTPTSRNMLDADGRFPKMVRAGIRAMRRTIDRALERHGRVHVIVEIGNHDLSSSIFLMECLANVYERDPRVTVDTSPMHYHYFEFGTTLIGTHHGHGAKADRLPAVMAADRPEAWGRSRHRYWWVGHIHHRTHSDFEGCSVESFRILAPPDAWAHQKGYRSKRGMEAIEIHRAHGEVARHTVSPEMFR